MPRPVRLESVSVPVLSIVSASSVKASRSSPVWLPLTPPSMVSAAAIWLRVPLLLGQEVSVAPTPAFEPTTIWSSPAPVSTVCGTAMPRTAIRSLPSPVTRTTRSTP